MKMLFTDIETGPNLGYVYGKYDQTVLRFEQEWQLLSFAFKWADSRKVIAVGGDKFTEEQMVLHMWNLLDEADVVVGHNSDKFDLKMLNVLFLKYNLNPPSPYKTVDTLKVARRYFRFMSNRLGDLGEKLGLGGKLDNGGFTNWLGCIQGDQKAWNKMLKYNKQDVVLTEKIYLKLRPWIDNHPAVNVIDQIRDGCPKCGSTHLQSRGTRKATKTGTYTRFQCQSCGGWSTSRSAQRVEVQFVN